MSQASAESQASFSGYARDTISGGNNNTIALAVIAVAVAVVAFVIWKAIK